MALTSFQRRRRIALAVLILLVVGAIPFVRPLGGGEMHEGLEQLGMFLIAAGILGRLWCTLYIGGRKAAEIVDTGPYAMCRNPLYFFSGIAATGVGAQTGSITIAALFGLGCLIAFAIVIRREEAFLAEQFGPAYARYCARVPRLIPNPSLYRSPDAVTVKPHMLWATLKDGLVFFVSVPAFEAIEHFQAIGLLDPVIGFY
ncbi:isoprenylcysteine carboxylmethyltransferase family protein [Aureimonas altamirensis]|uniref:methyltransferase family protein n=1 Tax=Aureimonas altamirensis TaxID=370622 RepID=UPI002036ED20|nr:isoprenylcysteine carboxylmethyltransferase family protein [Aureimonas altamirensis]MCM2504034.1 isoprenylcysteine carboxylmethyltransferase family protein [Aureimonas altamirensis]